MLSHKQLLFWEPKHNNEVLLQEEKKSKESKDSSFSHVYFIKKLFDLTQFIYHLSISLILNKLFASNLFGLNIKWDHGNAPVWKKKKKCTPKIIWTPSLSIMFPSCYTRIWDRYPLKALFTIVAFQVWPCFKYLSVFQIMYFSRCTFLLFQADLICSFPVHLSTL